MFRKRQVHSVQHYRGHSSDQIMVDTNVWLFLFPLGRVSKAADWKKQSEYSRGLSQLRESGAELLTLPVIISEYINAAENICRWSWNSHKRLKMSKKMFRSTPEYQRVVSSIIVQVNSIQETARVVDQSLSANDVSEILNHYSRDGGDLMDIIIAEKCRLEGYKVLTDDADFAVYDLDILTANSRILRR